MVKKSKHPYLIGRNSYKAFDFMYILGYTLTVASESRFSEVKKKLEGKGYALTWISGSHHIFTKKGTLPVSIPVHKGKVKSYYVKEIDKIE